MKTVKCTLVSVLILLSFQLLAQISPPVPPRIGDPIDFYKFNDTNWTSVHGFAPCSYSSIESVPGWGTNLAMRIAGSGPAWLQYNYIDVSTNGSQTNLTLPEGAITFWVRPLWSNTNIGGTGPGVPARLIELGAFTEQGNSGWFSLLLDEDGTMLSLGLQSNQYTAVPIQAPISWESNTWHFVVLNYTTTNLQLFLDGQLAASTNSGLPFWPSDTVLTNGIFIGSDSSGANLAQADFAYIRAYDWAILDSMIASQYNRVFNNYLQESQGMNRMMRFGFNEFMSSQMITPTNPLSLSVSLTGTNATLAIVGGTAGILYDLFYTTNLVGTNAFQASWAWLTKINSSQSYSLNNQPPPIFYALGTPDDSDGDGLPDAYEVIVSKTDPNNSTNSSSGGGIAPQVSITGPLPNMAVSGASFMLRGTISDPYSQVIVIGNGYESKAVLDEFGNFFLENAPADIGDLQIITINARGDAWTNLLNITSIPLNVTLSIPSGNSIFESTWTNFTLYIDPNAQLLEFNENTIEEFASSNELESLYSLSSMQINEVFVNGISASNIYGNFWSVPLLQVPELDEPLFPLTVVVDSSDGWIYKSVNVERPRKIRLFQLSYHKDYSNYWNSLDSYNYVTVKIEESIEWNIAGGGSGTYIYTELLEQIYPMPPLLMRQNVRHTVWYPYLKGGRSITSSIDNWEGPGTTSYYTNIISQWEYPRWDDSDLYPRTEPHYVTADYTVDYEYGSEQKPYRLHNRVKIDSKATLYANNLPLNTRWNVYCISNSEYDFLTNCMADPTLLVNTQLTALTLNGEKPDKNAVVYQRITNHQQAIEWLTTQPAAKNILHLDAAPPVKFYFTVTRHPNLLKSDLVDLEGLVFSETRRRLKEVNDPPNPYNVYNDDVPFYAEFKIVPCKTPYGTFPALWQGENYTDPKYEVIEHYDDLNRLSSATFSNLKQVKRIGLVVAQTSDQGIPGITYRDFTHEPGDDLGTLFHEIGHIIHLSHRDLVVNGTIPNPGNDPRAFMRAGSGPDRDAININEAAAFGNYPNSILNERR
jgi:hypothetical protein